VSGASLAVAGRSDVLRRYGAARLGRYGRATALRAAAVASAQSRDCTAAAGPDADGA
jgi:hypothetical protein